MSRNIPCPLCGGREYRTVYPTSPHALVGCCQCALVSVDPLPTPDERTQINDATYSTRHYRERYLRDESIFLRWFDGKLRMMEKFIPPGRLLDVGCSYGTFLEAARRRGWEAYGVERNLTTGEFARQRFGQECVFIGEVANAPFARESFDAVTLWDVLEHNIHPRQFLEDLRVFLRPGGIVALQCPNFGSFIARVKKEKWDWLTPGDHLYYFTPRTVSRLFLTLGWPVLSLFTWEPTSYFVESLLGFPERNGSGWNCYRATVVRGVRKLLFFLFVPWQWYYWQKQQGALVVTVARVL